MLRLSWVICAVALLVGAGGCGNSSSNTPTSPSSQPRGEFAQLDLVAGTGTTAATGRSVTVKYTGWLYDPSRPESKGTQFDSNTITFTLGAGSVIRGWDMGVVGMRVGGQRRLTIPPELAYGSAGRPPTIPGSATLVFDVELLNVQ
jgi:FKBP-type peptidyl-prolyl cis-trans isomerase